MQRPNPNPDRTPATCLVAVLSLLIAASLAAQDFPIVDTGQDACYDELGTEITCPAKGGSFYGQDAQHTGLAPRYVDNGDGTVSDLVTGLMWEQGVDLDKSTFSEARAGAATFDLAGYDDWRLPTIKELYSLIDFRGVTATSAAGSKPYLDTTYFGFAYGDESAGERFIDAQWVSDTEYVSTTMGGSPTVFGVNFADGRIKGYGYLRGGGEKTFYVRYVRGESYGVNDFVDHGDGTITDRATGLMWSRDDSGAEMTWEQALAWVAQKNGEAYLGHDDWRLPNAKEMQSIVDYTRSPDTTDSPAIDPLFEVTQLADGEVPYYWTSTTHLDGPADLRGSYAVYIAFGRALGYMETPPGSGRYQLMDVHGAGAQRSDPKTGNPAAYPYGHGPQGDVIRIYNSARLVRDSSGPVAEDPPARPKKLVARVITRRKIRLSWKDRSEDEVGFEIQRRTVGQGPFGQIAALENDAEAYRDRTVEPDTTYVYRVRAFNAAGESGWSNRVRATTDP